MISNFFVLSPRGDTIIAKQYRSDRGDNGAHERSHTEAFFRKIKFWDEINLTPGVEETSSASDSQKAGDKQQKTGDAPPVFMMPDGLSYLHVKRNGLIFGCAAARNASAVTIIGQFFKTETNSVQFWFPTHNFCIPFYPAHHLCIYPSRSNRLTVDSCQSVQGLLWDAFRRGNTKEFYFAV